RSTFDKNFNEKAISINPNTTLTLLSQPPDFGRLFNADGNNANKVKGNASANENPNMPMAGPSRSPLVAASTSTGPIIGPVHEKETTTSVDAIKNMPSRPPLSEFSSSLLA